MDELHKRLAAGDRDAFEELHAVYARRLLGAVLSWLGNSRLRTSSAEDIVQDVFVNAFRKRSQLAQANDLGAYLFIAAKNKCIDYIRSSARQAEPMQDINPESSSTDPVEEMIKEEDSDFVLRLSNEIPNKMMATAFFLRWKGQGAGEVAQNLGVSRANAYVLVHRAIDWLRERVSERASQQSRDEP